MNEITVAGCHKTSSGNMHGSQILSIAQNAQLSMYFAGARQELQRTTAPLSVTLPPKVVEGGSGLTPSVARMTFSGVSAQSVLDGSSYGTRPKAQRVENITRESGEKTISMRKSGSSSNLEDGGKTGETPGKSGTK